MSAAAKRWKYLRRLVHFRQMDFEFAFWQMFYLVSIQFTQCTELDLNYRSKSKSAVQWGHWSKEGYQEVRNTDNHDEYLDVTVQCPAWCSILL